MLLSLDIQNYILIEKTHIDFSPHFNVITGETGSGKSMLLSAIQLLTTSKISDAVIRKGANLLSVALTFSLENIDDDIKILINDYVDDEETLIISRIKRVGSPSSCSINGITVPQKIIKDVLTSLIYFSSQREQNTLLKKDNALKFIDNFASLMHLNSEVKAMEKQLKDIQNEIDEIREKCKKTEEERDYLLVCKKEIENVNPKLGEDDDIKETIKQAKRAVEYTSVISEVLTYIEKGDNNALSFLGGALRELSRFNDKEGSHLFDEEVTTFDSTYQMLSGIADNLKDKLKKVNLSDEELDSLQERDSDLNRLKRKYGGTLENVLKRLDEINEKLNFSLKSDDKLNSLISNYNSLLKDYKIKKENLYTKRVKGAAELSTKTEKHLHSLEMPKAIFKAVLEKGDFLVDDKCTFMFSANEGEMLGDVSEISSGGELSRLFLSLLSASPRFSNSRTIIFDEIDTGLGGKAALALSLYLKELSEFSELIVITHSALVESKADCHILVRKIEQGGRTYSVSSVIALKERVEETARLLSGDITNESLDLAKSILKGEKGLF